MRIEEIVLKLVERQKLMEKQVFGVQKFDAVDFAKTQGRYLGLSEAIMVISDEMQRDED